MTVVQSASATPASETPLQLRIAIFCVMTCNFMQSLDQTIANVALPHMQGSLQADRSEITWVLTSYIIATAIFTPASGWLASRFGHKQVILTSLLGFTVTSALCGAAQSLDEMILFRLLQGLSGAVILPVAQTIVLNRYPLERRGQILALWGTLVMVAPIIGPTLGGWLTDSYSWRWVFYINVPIGALCILGIVTCLKEQSRPHVVRFDGFGFAALGIMLGSSQLVLDRGTTLGWFESQEIVIETGIAILALYIFAVHAFTARAALFPKALFMDRNFISGLILTFVTSAIVISGAALLPPYLQTLGGYSVLDAGLLIAPRGLGMVVAMRIISRTVMKADPRYYIFCGSLVVIATLWEMSRWTPDVNAWTIGIVSMVQGFGMGFLFVPNNILSFMTLSMHYRTDGAAVQSVFRSMGGALGISLTATIVSTYSQIVHAQLASSVTPFNRALSVNAPGMMWNPLVPPGVQALDGIIQRNAAIVAYSDAFLLMFYLSLIAPIVALMMRKPTMMDSTKHIELTE